MNAHQTLQTERLTLRAPTPQDWDGYAAFMDTDAARFFKGHRNLTEAWKSFGTLLWHWLHLGFGPWAVTQDGETCIGIVGPKRPPGWPEGELTWIAYAPALGQGIAGEAARAARADAYDRLGWDTAVSYIEAENTRSIALAKRLGATRDESAERPAGAPVLVYRHPGKEAA